METDPAIVCAKVDLSWYPCVVNPTAPSPPILRADLSVADLQIFGAVGLRLRVRNATMLSKRTERAFASVLRHAMI